jgi:Tfp pilus assembly protein PilF
MFTGEPADDGGKNMRRKGLVFELNRSGKYAAMKTRLKEAAQAIIKERFFAGGEGVQGKYNELYVHLVEEMHATLRALGAPSQPPGAGTAGASQMDVVDHDALVRCKALAGEYEVNGELDLSDKWHQERVLLARALPEVWCDYGAFLARRETFGKAEEAYKEALGCDPAHVPALVALCALMVRDEEYARAEVYGQAVTSGAGDAPANPVAWSLLAATYSALDRETDATNCNYEARRLTAQVMSSITTTAAASNPSALEAFAATALTLLDLHMPGEARALLEEGGEGANGLTRRLCLARAALLEGSTSSAYGHIMDALSVDATDPRAFELLGDLHASESRLGEAEEAYSHAMALSAGPNPPASLKLILNLGRTLLAAGKLGDARGVYMAGCRLCPCASTWLGAGIAMLRDGDLDGAEAALAEARRRGLGVLRLTAHGSHAYDLRLTVYSLWPTVYSLRFTACDLWLMAYGLGFAVSAAVTWIGPKFALARLVLASDDK